MYHNPDYSQAKYRRSLPKEKFYAVSARLLASDRGKIARTWDAHTVQQRVEESQGRFAVGNTEVVEQCYYAREGGGARGCAPHRFDFSTYYNLEPAVVIVNAPLLFSSNTTARTPLPVR